MQGDLDVVVLRKTSADLLNIGERMRKGAVWRGQISHVFAESFELGKSES